jgi:hypothetical protein
MKSVKLWFILVLIQILLPTADAFSCTSMMAIKNGMVLAGHNEDWNNQNHRINFIPADADVSVASITVGATTGRRVE